MPSDISQKGMQLPLCEYTEVEKQWQSKSAAYNELGIGRAIKGCKAKVLKSKPMLTFLVCHRCNLGCEWKGVLVSKSQDAWELRVPSGSEHNTSITQLKGNRGFKSIEQRDLITQKLLSSVVVRPRQALNALRSDPDADDEGVDLSLVQSLKKMTVGSKATMKQDVGDLASASKEFARRPVSDVAGYLAVKRISVTAGGKPYVTLVATTKRSLHRWANSSVCSTDGGYKYCLLGWPLTLDGVINPAGTLNVTSLTLTSHMTEEHIQAAKEGFKHEVESVTGKPASKRFSMSDGELAYRNSLSNTFSSSPLMCAFHWINDAPALND